MCTFWLCITIIFFEGGFPITNSVSSYHIFGPVDLPIFGSAIQDCEDFEKCISLFKSSTEMEQGCNSLLSGAAVLCSGNTSSVHAQILFVKTVCFFFSQRSSSNRLCEWRDPFHSC